MSYQDVVRVDYTISLLGEFKNKEIECIYLEGEVRKSIRLVRYMILFCGLAYFLTGIPEFFTRRDVALNILTVTFITRGVIFISGAAVFVIMKRTLGVKAVSGLICAFGSALYIHYFWTSFYFIPMQIMAPTFAVILLATCLLMMPGRWAVNMGVSVIYTALFIAVEPVLCPGTTVEQRIIALSYMCGYVAIIGLLFYTIGKHKRNYFAKAQQLEELARTDQLTKTHNRKSCDDILENKCTGKTEFSIIMFDIDDFKLINDTYGHVAGDDVIVSITDLARRIIRKDDILARWGGEEFIVVMLEASLHEAAELAKRLKEQLAGIEYDGISQIITCSFGVTAFIEGDSVKSIIRRADQLLYQAKEYGKNRVVAG